jgi:hypothetical protein
LTLKISLRNPTLLLGTLHCNPWDVIRNISAICDAILAMCVISCIVFSLQVATQIVASLMALEVLDDSADIRMYINSGGASHNLLNLEYNLSLLTGNGCKKFAQVRTLCC